MSLSEYNYKLTTKDVNDEWEPNEYKILNDGCGGGTFARESSQATVIYITEYYYVERFIDVVLGKTVVGSGGFLKRSAASPTFDGSQGSTPEEHPYFYNYFASSATVEPLGKPSNLVGQDSPNWPKVKITVVFRPVDYNIVTDSSYGSPGYYELNRFVTKQTTGNVEFQTVNGFFSFVNTPEPKLPLDIQPAMTVPATRLVYTWHQVPTTTRTAGTATVPDLGKVPNYDTVQSCLGYVNLYTFDGYPPGTVLFSSWEPSLVMPQTATESNYYWNISYTFAVRDYGDAASEGIPYKVAGEHIGWNYAFSPYSGFWDLYTSDGYTTGYTMYDYIDFTNLFKY